jgi:hypothetical protein
VIEGVGEDTGDLVELRRGQLELEVRVGKRFSRVLERPPRDRTDPQPPQELETRKPNGRLVLRPVLMKGLIWLIVRRSTSWSLK